MNTYIAITYILHTVLLIQSSVTGNPFSNMEAPNTESSETEIFLGTQNLP